MRFGSTAHPGFKSPSLRPCSVFAEIVDLGEGEGILGGGVGGCWLVLPLGGLTAVPASGAAAIGYPNPGTVTGDVRVHDPSMIRAANGTYYLFSTHNGIEIRSSADRVAFTLAGSVLPSGATWASAYGNIHDPWAPDVSYHNGTYWLYYSVSSFGSNHSAIGLATRPTAAPGRWRDQGP